MSKYFRLIFIVLVVPGLVSLILPAQEAPLASTQAVISVDTLQDEENSDGDCSLREAIRAANENLSVDACPAGNGVNPDTINFSNNGTIVVTEPLTVIAGGPLVIDGAGAISISGDDRVGIFVVTSDADLTLEHLRLVRGNANAGGGIHNSGRLVVSGCTISNNHVSWSGGGIFNQGTMTVTNSTLSGNSSLSGGGGIYSFYGIATLINSTLSGNSSAYGAGISNGNILTIQDSTISDNTATVTGGGIDNYGTLLLTSSTLVENRAGSGGGITHWVMGTLNIINCTLSRNSADRGGGIENGGPLEIMNSTLSGNSAANNGGGIQNTGTLTITNSTLAYNSAGLEGGGIYNNPIYGVAEMNNSIIAFSPSVSNCAGAPIIDAGYNLEDTDTCGFTASSSITNTPPMLSPLQDDWGSTLTHALMLGSPAIDHGDPVNCPPTDQRGIYRPIDGEDDGSAVCDIGSYEFVIISRLYLPMLAR
jgi:CSLREA domain-containing protein